MSEPHLKEEINQPTHLHDELKRRLLHTDGMVRHPCVKYLAVHNRRMCQVILTDEWML